ncbi:MAG: putative 3-demethylubiquinone-9 3-O-methyltransferase [Proteobacteria bacterium]|nr:putative 3-demethylubiquinone-9 3-O-methyltransferase [Pseudomonadota bacterium]
MPIGPAVRKMFGRHERQIAELYRSIYIDLDSYIEVISNWISSPRRILEVGAGEGAVTERLAQAFPDAEILGIDIMPAVGRLYEGPVGKVRFEEKTVQQLAVEQPGAFDFVILSDVIHHVPPALRREILEALRACVAPGGRVIFKDWARSKTPIHWMCMASDKYLTGDDVNFLSRDEAAAAIEDVFGGGTIAATAFVKPWRNNFVFLLNG